MCVNACMYCYPHLYYPWLGCWLENQLLALKAGPKFEDQLWHAQWNGSMENFRVHLVVPKLGVMDTVCAGCISLPFLCRTLSISSWVACVSTWKSPYHYLVYCCNTVPGRRNTGCLLATRWWILLLHTVAIARSLNGGTQIYYSTCLASVVY